MRTCNRWVSLFAIWIAMGLCPSCAFNMAGNSPKGAQSQRCRGLVDKLALEHPNLNASRSEGWRQTMAHNLVGGCSALPTAFESCQQETDTKCEDLVQRYGAPRVGCNGPTDPICRPPTDLPEIRDECEWREELASCERGHVLHQTPA